MVISVFEQGDVLRIQGISFPVLVVTTNVYNDMGQAIVCPIMNERLTSPIAYYLSDIGTVLCDQVRFVDLTRRFYKKLASVSMGDIVEVSNIIESLFDYV